MAPTERETHNLAIYSEVIGTNIRDVCQNATPRNSDNDPQDYSATGEIAKVALEVLLGDDEAGTGTLEVYCTLTDEKCPFSDLPKFYDPKGRKPQGGVCISVLETAGNLIGRCPGSSIKKSAYDEAFLG